MSKLIDAIKEDNLSVNLGKFWFIARAESNTKFTNRFKDAWLVLTGKAEAYHHAQDINCVDTNARKKVEAYQEKKGS